MINSKWGNEQQKLSELLNKIENGKIKIPMFQRNYVWTSQDIVDLLNSIKDGRPIGNFIFWSTDKKIEIKNIIIEEISKGTSKEEKIYVIDGQQRLTTLSICYFFNVIKQCEESEEIDILKFKKIIYDAKEQLFKVVALKEQNKEHYFKLEEVFVKSKAYNTHRVYDEMFQTRTLKIENPKIREKFKYDLEDINQSFLSLEIGYLNLYPENTLDNVINIFEKINTKGKKLNTFDIINAKWNQYNFDLKKEFDNLINNDFLVSKHEIDNETLLDSLFLIIDDNEPIYEKLNKINFEIKNNDYPIINNKIKKWKDSVKCSTRFLKNIGFNSKTLPSKNIFKWLVYMFFKNENKSLDANHNNNLKKYIALLCLNNWYEKSTISKLKANITFINDFLKDNELNISKIFKGFDKKYFDDDFFMNLDAKSKNNMTAKLITSILQRNGRDFLEGIDIDKNEFDLHHIYPKNGYNEKKYDDIKEYIESYANLTPLKKETNNHIKNKKFSKYFDEYKGKNNKLEKDLEEHCIDYNMWIKDNNPNEILKALKNRSKKLVWLLSKQFNI